MKSKMMLLRQKVETQAAAIPQAKERLQSIQRKRQDDMWRFIRLAVRIDSHTKTRIQPHHRKTVL